MRKALKRTLVIGGAVLGVLLVAVVIGIVFFDELVLSDPFTPLYADNCATCHGEAFDGTALGPALVGRALDHGDSVAEIVASIASGFPERGMPGWAGVFDEGQIRSLAILVAEKRVNRSFTDFKADKQLAIPTEPIASEAARFRIETFATGLAPFPFSIAPLPDGSVLVTEKVEGLSVIAPDGSRSDPISGTPETSDTGMEVAGLNYGMGWLLEVALHPDYEHNGWVYLLHTELCDDCDEGANPLPHTMTRVIRGRIVDGEWRDQEIIWEVPHRFYTSMPDIAAGGRLTFDPAGYVFFSVGMKGLGNYVGIQDLGTPYGKVHRIHDDGRIPADNPFLDVPGAMPSIYCYGHRSPQGLEYDAKSQSLWGTEMGPRGGDEVNLLLPGRNYGWPLYSKGVDYDGTPVEYWKELGIEFDLEDIEQPVVDLTPSPAVSSFIIYAGEAFPGWSGDFLVGSLKATELYRFEIEDGRLQHTELLLENLARIRDIEAGPDGTVYLLLEHESGSQIVRLVPEPV
jgi:glucose/arabinose dehydrogenase